MITLSTYADLIAEINRDREIRGRLNARYAVRIILLDNFEMLRNLVQDLNLRVVELSELMEHDNYWFGPNKLCDIVKEQKDNAVIIPVSEVIRFYDDAKLESFLATVLLLQNQDNRRIYIPLIGLKSRFEKFWNTFNRQSEGAPVWYLHSFEEPQKTINVYSCNKDVHTQLSTIKTNREWLDYWKEYRTTPLITKTRSLISRWEEFLPDGCFDKDTIENSKDIISKILKLNFNRSYRSNEEQHWGALLTACESNQNFRSMFPVQILEKLLGIQDFTQYDDVELMKIYLDSDRHFRWLINVLLDQIGMFDSYFKNVISNIGDFTENSLIHGLYFEIFNPNMHIFTKQRRELIEALPKEYLTLLQRFIDDWFERLNESGFDRQLCTRYSIEERQHIILDIATKGDFADLWNIYPELAAYLDWAGVTDCRPKVDSQFIEYFSEYTKAKVLNKPSPEFQALFEKLNSSKDSFYKWYYAVPELENKKECKIVQFDGVGAEWLPYILYCINLFSSRYAKDVESCELRRVNLPSITSLNRIEEASFVRDFDTKIIHKPSGYEYPRSLIEALELIKEMVKVHVMMSPENKICICADHGASFMCRKDFGAIIMHKCLEAKHEGRYYEGAKNTPDNEAFFNVKQYFVALKHHVISTNVRREVHGGATPEEVLVPCVYVSKTEAGYQREYSITLSGHTLNFDSRILQVSIDPNPDTVSEFWCNETAIEPKLVANKYLLDLSDFEPGKYKILIKVNKNTYTERIEIGSGYVEEDLFDE